MSNNDLGLIHIYCGDGKGKTTAAIGLGVRSAGFGYKVLLVQFLKDGTSSELNILKNIPNITIISGKCFEKFTFNMIKDELECCKEYNSEIFNKVVKLLEKEEFNILILDECIGAINTNTLNEYIVIDFLKNKPENLEVILTGRNPSEKLKEMANYISEIKKLKHPYDKGIIAREGIEK